MKQQLGIFLNLLLFFLSKGIVCTAPNHHSHPASEFPTLNPTLYIAGFFIQGKQQPVEAFLTIWAAISGSCVDICLSMPDY